MIKREKIIKYLRSTEFHANEFSKDNSTKVCAVILDKRRFYTKNLDIMNPIQEYSKAKKG